MESFMSGQDFRTSPWWDLPIAAIDVETTGLSPQEDRIIEIAIVEMTKGVVSDRYCQLVDPERPIPEDSTRITGIKDSDVEDQPTFKDIGRAVSHRLTDRIILGYNVVFDRGFVENELIRIGETWPKDAILLDPLTLARGLFPDQRGFKLGLIAKRLNIPLEEAHRADHDAEAAGRILYAMRDQLPESLGELLELQSEWARAYAQRSANWRGGGRMADTSLVVEDTSSDQDGAYRLGPAYRYSKDSDRDPVRFIFRRLPTTGAARNAMRKLT
jgi:DNA polymerase III epsilon subunit family exonuclease